MTFEKWTYCEDHVTRYVKGLLRAFFPKGYHDVDFVFSLKQDVQIWSFVLDKQRFSSAFLLCNRCFSRKICLKNGQTKSQEPLSYNLVKETTFFSLNVAKGSLLLGTQSIMCILCNFKLIIHIFTARIHFGFWTMVLHGFAYR